LPVTTGCTKCTCEKLAWRQVVRGSNHRRRGSRARRRVNREDMAAEGDASTFGLAGPARNGGAIGAVRLPAAALSLARAACHRCESTRGQRRQGSKGKKHTQTDSHKAADPAPIALCFQHPLVKNITCPSSKVCENKSHCLALAAGKTRTSVRNRCDRLAAGGLT
jgi:hypothetical protein